MIIAVKLSYKLNYLSFNELKKIKNHFQSNQLPIFDNKMYDKKIFQIIQKDKKNIGGILNFVLIKKIGSAFLSKRLNIENLNKLIK